MAIGEELTGGGAPSSLGADAELLGEFVVEAREHLAAIESRTLALERGLGDSDAIHSLFRAFHTIKGLAGFLDLGAIEVVAHEVETVLDEARNGRLAITPGVIAGILESKDFVECAIAALAGSGAGMPAGERIVTRLRALVAGGAERDTALDGLEDLSLAAAGHPAHEGPERWPAESGRNDAFVKVPTAKLDALVDMVGEMAIAQSLVGHDPDLNTQDKPLLSRNLAQLARLTEDVQRTSLALRMVGVGRLFHKMSRLVRDLALKTGKQVEVALAGEDTELDRNLVEEIADPLMHMVRNALDHGIESPRERARAGKSATARITLRAAHQSGHIAIAIADDGRGLDREGILHKAVERGLAAPGAALTDAEVFNFIFHPGFSTAAGITAVSGRGVGMDVVQKCIQKLRGRIEIESAAGAGATFRLKVPLTLAIVEALVAGVGAERYLIPIYAVREMIRPTPQTILTVRGRVEMALVRNELLPVLRLARRFHLAPRPADSREGLLIVAESGAGRFCALVDEVLGKQEVVIKSLGEKFQGVEGIAGGAILADGSVGLILDMERLWGDGGGA